VAFYQRKEVKTLLGYLRLAVNPSDDTAFDKVVNTPTRGIGAVTVSRLKAASREAGVSLLEGCRLPAMSQERASAKLAGFAKIMERIRGLMDDRPVAEIVRESIDLSGLRAAYEKSKDPRAAEQIENLNELVSAAAEHDERHESPTLQSFLEEVALVSDVDNWDQGQRVTLMTLHSAKGLEFPMVFLAGMEEGLLPHSRSANKERTAERDKAVEEERRLAYVGITRAQDELILTSTLTRTFQGATTPRTKSPFLDEVPGELIVEELKAERFEPEFDDDEVPFERPSRPAASKPKWPAFKGRSPGSAPRRRPTGPPKKKESGPSAGAFSGGDTVMHPIYGIGVVLESSGMGESEKVKVFFKKGVTKTLVAKYANLEKTMP
jgi:DNA helicase-2/ATP-dependent DNA helicase PcrA